jgi:hypothetical protein
MTSFLVVAVLIGAPAPLAGTPEIVAIHITQSGWGFKERNLALAKSGNAYSDRTYRVASGARRPRAFTGSHALPDRSARTPCGGTAIGQQEFPTENCISIRRVGH